MLSAEDNELRSVTKSIWCVVSLCLIYIAYRQGMHFYAAVVLLYAVQYQLEEDNVRCSAYCYNTDV